MPLFPQAARELGRWRALPTDARRYLAHVALLTAGLAVPQLFFNLAVLALGHGREALGLLNTATFVAAAALSAPAWFGAVRLGLRRSLLAAVALQCAAALAFAVAASLPALLLSAALGGAAAVLFQVAAAPFMMRHSDAETRDHLFSASSAVAIGISGAATAVAGPLPAALGGLIGAGPESAAAYRACYLVAAAIVALSALPLLGVAGDAPAPQSGQASASPRLGALAGEVRRLWGLVRSRAGELVRLLIPPALISWGAALLIPYLNLFFVERFGVDNVTLGALFAAMDLATGAALLLGPSLSRRIGAMPTVVLTRAVALPLTLLTGFAPALWLAGPAALARVVLFNMATPLYEAAALARTDDDARPAVIGLMGAAASSGYLLGPLISTYVQERYGFAPLFLATTAIYTLSVLVTWWWFVRPVQGRTGEG